ncbi:MAG: hypothetical protein Q8R02_23445 [Hyphomonadaceae bacterium]|nr:hypothetical protein [Hyphomonadaceae bacterium]
MNPWENYAQAEEGPWKKYGAPEEPPTSAPRLGGQFAQGALDAITNTAMAPFDLSAAITNKLGLTSGPSRVRQGIEAQTDYTATLPLRLRDAVSQGSLGPLTESRTARFEPENRSEKIANKVGEGVGAVASTLLPAGVIAKGAKAGTMTHGLAQTMASQPVTQLTSGAVGGGVTGATDDPLMGLVAALAVPVGAATVRGAISPTTNRLSDAERKLVAVAQREGIPLTPSQQTGSPSLRGLEETMARMPLSNTPMQKTYAGQREAFNRAVMTRTGADAADASPDTMRKTFQTMGSKFDDLASRTTVNVDEKFAGDVQRVSADYGRRLETDVRPVFQSYMDDLAPLLQSVSKGEKPQLDGQIYGRIRSDIATRMRESGNNKPLQRALGGLVESLDDAMQRSATGPLAAEWGEARRQYQALMTVDKAMRGGTQTTRTTGDIPFSGLTSAVRGADAHGYASGRGQLNDLSRVGDFLAQKVPNSGTPERLGWTNVLTGGALFGGGMASGLGLPVAIAATAAPWAASKLYNTPLAKAYLTNQAAGTTDLGALYGSEALRRLIEGGQGKGEPTALARALMQASEKRAGAAR